MSGTIIQELQRLLQRQQLSGQSTVWLSDANRQAFFRPPPAFTPPMSPSQVGRRSPGNVVVDSSPAPAPAPAPVAAPPSSPSPSSARQTSPVDGVPGAMSPPPPSSPAAPPPAAPPKACFAGLDWSALASGMSGCRRCNLSSSRSHLQFGYGQQRARVMFIADYPTKEEDAANDIVNSEAGKLLFGMIRAMRLDPNSTDPNHAAYVTHVLKCRLSDARRHPTQAEVRACLPCLWQQIELCQPQAIVLFGMLPLRALLDPAYSDRHRHQWHQYQGIPVMPTLHPNEILRMQNQPQAFIEVKRKVWKDLQQVMTKLQL